jgi:hypothetical protein
VEGSNSDSEDIKPARKRQSTGSVKPRGKSEEDVKPSTMKVAANDRKAKILVDSDSEEEDTKPKSKPPAPKSRNVKKEPSVRKSDMIGNHADLLQPMDVDDSDDSELPSEGSDSDAPKKSKAKPKSKVATKKIPAKKPVVKKAPAKKDESVIDKAEDIKADKKAGAAYVGSLVLGLRCRLIWSDGKPTWPIKLLVQRRLDLKRSRRDSPIV